MKKNTVTNLFIGTVALLGATYILESYIKTKKREKEIEKSKIETVDETGPKVYHTIGNIVEKDGKVTTESVKEIKKVI